MTKKINPWVALTGVIIGVAAVLLSYFGNPGNMGFCIACFLRDIAGATGLHSAGVVQYFRPEIVGLVLGAMIMALATKEFRSKGGSAPALRFLLGAFVMIGALVFLGCPLRMVIRLGGGDLNALLGLAGFIAGILVGVVFLKKGFSLKRAYAQSPLEGFVLPFVLTVLFVLFVAVPALFKFSEKGPGSMAAPVLLALACGLVVGALCQRSRLCMAGGLRDVFMFKDFNLLTGFAAIFVTIVIGNLILNKFNLSFTGQPVAHSDGLWNFLGMALAGWGSILLGGCPLRQLILTGEGNSDSAVTVLGMLFGAAISHNFGLAGAAASADSAGGASTAGKIALGIGFAVMLIVSVVNSRKEKSHG